MFSLITNIGAWVLLHASGNLTRTKFLDQMELDKQSFLAANTEVRFEVKRWMVIQKITY